MLFRECFREFAQKQYCGFPVFEYIKKAQVQCERDILRDTPQVVSLWASFSRMAPGTLEIRSDAR